MKKKICIILSTLLVLGVGLGLGLFFGLKEKRQLQNNPKEELLSTGLYDESGLVRDWDDLTTGEEPSITIEGNVLIECDKTLTGELVLPEGLLAIGTNAFLECNLSKISLPSSLKELAKDAFYNSVELEEVSIPSNSALEVIGYGAFTYCHKLKTLNIPSTVTKIGVSAFLGCTVLDHIVIPNSITTIGDALFKDCEALNDLSYGDITEIGSQAFYNCRSLESFDFKNTTKIGYSAFWNCKGLERIDLPETLMLIENHVFARCSNITAVTFGGDSTKISVGTFEDCLSLSEIVLPGDLDRVPEYCFSGCVELEEVVLGEQICRIGKFAFKDCKNLSITFSAQGSWGYLEDEQLVSFDLCDNEANRKEVSDGKEDKVFEIMKYTISFVLNGYGEEISNRKGSYIPDELPTPIDETMVFDGWYLDEDLNTPVEAGAIIFGDITLYAKWIEDPWK